MDTRKWLSENMEDIIAYIPCYQGGNFVNAIKKDGQAVLINKSIKWVINTLVKDSSFNIGYIKRKFGESFGATNFIPLPLGPRKVFIPVKIRKTIGINDGSFGYIDIMSIDNVVKKEGAVINLECGTSISCLESAKTVKGRINIGKLMMDNLSSLLMGEHKSKEGISDYERVATKADINMLVYEIMKLKDKIEKEN